MCKMEAVKVTAEADEEVFCPRPLSCRPSPPMRAIVNIACLSSKTDGDPRSDVLDIGTFETHRDQTLGRR
ncbi:hypothetical protein POTOM_059379 [Populus tomentosa]|uniref:Uncharacterized protein n=1 Tax=Populus tomentosa TaxID=118781 RepID=A0A8X7XPX1_POPTO|nr:hypothetical protein POTOM_059379 [Populus tomentosa]